MLKLFNENLAHSGDKLIKSKCVALINKGPQTSVTTPVDPQSVVPTSTKQEPTPDDEEDTPANEEEDTPEDK